ncbi:hypothetical protein B0O99DRAFT_605034 [Bisporella sp. PMI_857]|nr:hypothetical protein B0O99DRAFT_605034 [Bisporella sp. PMI_857]
MSLPLNFAELDPRLRAQSTVTVSPTNTSAITPAPPGQISHVGNGSPHADSYSHTPQSGGNATDDHDALDGINDGAPNDPKRRACEACRGLKVRCEPDLNNMDGPCKRCAKANRNCVITIPSRKRQKKTDSRVAELEKKIDALQALTASLQGKSSDHGLEGMRTQNHVPYQQVTAGGYGPPFTGRTEPRITNEWTSYLKPSEFEAQKSSPAPPMVVAGQKRKHTESSDTSSQTSRSIAGPGSGSVNGPAGYPASEGVRDSFHRNEYHDVIDRGLVTSEMATKMFNCYTERMAIHMPAVVFPPNTTAAEVRKSKPTLFLAVLSASCGMNYPDLQRILTKELMSIFAERIICNGEKTLEIIQALTVSTLWYWPPEHFEELKFYQLIHIAAVMALDIGIGKKSKNTQCKSFGTNAGLWRDHPWRRTPFPDPESIVARRAWLGCYFLCCNASMGLRRPNLIRWSPFMTDCLNVLERSPEAAPSDKILCQLVRSQQIAEEIGTQFSMDDPSANVNIADPKVQYALKGFERDLTRWTNHIPPDTQSVTLTMTGHVVNLFMHEIAMHVNHNVDEFKPPFTEAILSGQMDAEGPESLTSVHISALSTCLTAIDGIIETFLKFDVDTIHCLPIVHFVRVAYAVVVLIKMYFAAATPHSELGKVINKDNMKVEQYLDSLAAVFKASAAQEKSRPSAKFLMVLLMLKTWFHRQREGKPSGEPIAIPPTRNPPNSSADSVKDTNTNLQQQQQQQQGQQPLAYSPENTGLHMLSEVATGNSGGQARPRSVGYMNNSNDWQQQQSFLGYDNPMNQIAQNMGQGYGVLNGNVDPSLNMDLAYTDGFEQAMGMTLGAGDFGAYFNEDTFFGSLMDNVGGGSGFF